MFLWKKVKKARRAKRKGNSRESSNPNFILCAKQIPEPATRGKQLFRKQVPQVTRRSDEGGGIRAGDSGPIKLSLLTLGKKIKNPQNCPLCKKNLTTWFNQCASCSVCDLRTCRSCADYDTLVGDWICQKCVNVRSNKDANSSALRGHNRSYSRYWYDDIISLKKNLAALSVPADTHIDISAAARYEQVEKFISHHLNITPEALNTTDVGKVFKSSRYDLLFARYHEVFSQEIAELLRFFKSRDELKEAISLKKLKELMDKVSVAAKMESVMEMNGARTNKGDGGRAYTPTYPDILSTAILNRIIIDAQSTKSHKSSVSPISNDSAVLADYSSTSTDLPESGSEKDTHNWVLASATERNATVLRTSDEESIIDTPVGGSLGSNWSTENLSTSQPQLKIEESIEEITTTTYESDSSDSRSSSSSDGDIETHLHESRSPAPETQEKVGNWEHNWLFKKRKDLLKKQESQKTLVTMLVPNPTEEVDVMIGDEKASDMEDDLDELDVSELGYVVVGSDEPVLTAPPKKRETPVKVAVPQGTEKTRVHEALSTKPPVPASRAVTSPVPELTVQPATPDRKEADLEFSVEHVQPKPTPSPPAEFKDQIQEEALYETDHSVSSNEIILMDKEQEKPAEVEPSVRRSRSSSSSSDSDERPELPPMRIAEREKEKWKHPVPVKYNPYAVENLSKRLKEKEFTLPSVQSRDDTEDVLKVDDFPSEKRNNDKIRRDYYVNNSSSEDRKHSISSSSSEGDFHKVKMHPQSTQRPQHKVLVPPPLSSPKFQTSRASAPPVLVVAAASEVPDAGADLAEIKLPSVRNLAKKFSSPVPEEKPVPREIKPSSWKPIIGTTPLKQQPASSVVNSETKLVAARQFDATLPSSSATPRETTPFSSYSLSESSNEEPDGEFAVSPTPLSPTGIPIERVDKDEPTSLYYQFSRSKPDIPVTPQEMPWKSTRELVRELEIKARNSNLPSPAVRRSKSEERSSGKFQQGLDPVEHFAQQLIAARSTKIIAEDPELKKLKRSIVRGSRTRKGSSGGLLYSEDSSEHEQN